jgi:hypothetical protein
MGFRAWVLEPQPSEGLGLFRTPDWLQRSYVLRFAPLARCLCGRGLLLAIFTVSLVNWFFS